jgi:exodeoxyribonuclease VII small subunit
MTKKQSFEDAVKKLEEIVNQFESGEMALEQMIQQYEKGAELAKFCLKKLEEAENKITSLKINENYINNQE